MALLTVGNAVAAKVELIGEAGDKALVAAEEEGQTKGLAAFLEAKGGAEVAKDVLVDGLPPLPSGQSLRADGKWEVYKYGLKEGSYSEE